MVQPGPEIQAIGGQKGLGEGLPDAGKERERRGKRSCFHTRYHRQEVKRKAGDTFPCLF